MFILLIVIYEICIARPLCDCNHRNMQECTVLKSAKLVPVKYKTVRCFPKKKSAAKIGKMKTNIEQQVIVFCLK